MWIHLWDAHRPYDPPARYLTQAGGAPYLGEVARMDDALGRLFDTLDEFGHWADTLLVVTADHGEGLGEHDELTHANFVFDTTLRVPMLVRHHDGHRAGERSDENVTVADVYPTVVDALDMGALGDVDGASLFRRELPPDRGTYFESYYGAMNYQWSPIVGWADRDGKYIHCSSPELYDVDADPKEQRNLFPRGDEHAFRAKLEEILQRTPLERTVEEFDRSRIPILEALGYAGGGPSPEILDPLAASDLPAPHHRAEELRHISDSRVAEMEGDLPEAIRLLQRVCADNPRNHEGLSRLGKHLMDESRHAEAIEPLQRFVEIGPKWPEVYFNLALCLKQTERSAEAIDAFLDVLEIDPDHIFSMAQLIDVYRKLERPDDEQKMLAHLEETKTRLGPERIQELMRGGNKPPVDDH